MTTLILHDPQTTLHHSVELLAHRLIPAHESPDRIERILTALRANEGPWKLEEVSLPPEESLWPSIPSSVHSKEYIQHLRTIFGKFIDAGIVDEGDMEACVLPECFPHAKLLETTSKEQPMMRSLQPPRDTFAQLGHYAFDMSAGMSKDTFQSAIAAVNLALRGVDKILDESYKMVFCLTRPPGHHACPSLAGGYCYINTVAVAAEYLISHLPSSTSDGPRVAILDLDVHHGNGTQAIFYHRKSPAYISIHGEDEYPYYTGSESETGAGDGEGYNVNLPLPLKPRSTREDYLKKLDEALRVIRDVWKAEVVLLSMGFDTYCADILGGFDLEVEDYTETGIRLRDMGLPVLAVLEGGYHAKLGELVAHLLKGFASETS